MGSQRKGQAAGAGPEVKGFTAGKAWKKGKALCDLIHPSLIKLILRASP